MSILTRTIWTLSLISLFTDVASEMLYPVMPVYLQTIGFSIAWIGLLEGIAEATAGLSKGYFGNLSDIMGKRVPFVRIGYAFSAISKPLMAVFIQPVWVFFARTTDRLGKGIRTGARDAILSAESLPETRAKVFGFHRALDTLGAAIGPALALVYLHYHPENYRTLFFIAFIPGILAVIISLLLREKTTTRTKPTRTVSFFAYIRWWKKSPPAYRRLVTGLLIFALINSSDVFLLLKATQSGLSDSTVIGLYIFYNLVYAGASYPAGFIADKSGLKKTFIAGLFLFSLTYTGFGISGNLYIYVLLFFAYGLFAAATEGISKAWISNCTQKADWGTALGTYTGFQSICALLASSIAGLIWTGFGAGVLFISTGILSLLVVLYFLLFVPYHITEESA